MVINREQLLVARQLLWYGRCEIKTFTTAKDPITKQTKNNVPMVIAEDVPCHLSRKKKDTPTTNDKNNPVDHTISLSLQNDIFIPGGSEITVTQNGRTEVFRYSGYSNQYIAHQEIILVAKDLYA